MEQTVQLPSDLYEAVRKRAAAQQKTAEALVVEWVSEKVSETDESASMGVFEREIAAFKALRTQLLEQYPEQYVAIYQGQVVQVGDNRLALVKQVYDQFGEVPCYVEKVTAEPLRRVRVPSVAAMLARHGDFEILGARMLTWSSFA